MHGFLSQVRGTEGQSRFGRQFSGARRTITRGAGAAELEVRQLVAVGDHTLDVGGTFVPVRCRQSAMFCCSYVLITVSLAATAQGRAADVWESRNTRAVSSANPPSRMTSDRLARKDRGDPFVAALPKVERCGWMS